ncbi:hypothetical protein MMC29_007637, partial [Sticta canariensis]|nr:hypothetical protein [Sticta canariensis]
MEAQNENSPDGSIQAGIEQPAESSAMAELGHGANPFYIPEEIESIKDLDASLFHKGAGSLFQDGQPSMPPLPTQLELPPWGEHDNIDDYATELDDDATELDEDATELDDDATELDEDATELDDDATELDEDATELDDDAT